ncbi:MAG: major capsid protein [Microviridae sp.]|nr:MAG: major capsid protein [Microviridae sp.]
MSRHFPSTHRTSSHLFSESPAVKIQRSSFPSNSKYATTFNEGDIVPFYCKEALPGDTFKLKLGLFARTMTMKFPIMHNIYLDVFYFAVPMRLLWDNFQRFMGQQDNPDDSTDYLIPQVISPSGFYNIGSIFDYFGLPVVDSITPKEGTISASSLPFRAYNLIVNDWFRDQNLSESLSVPKGDGPDDPSLFSVVKRAKRHDYFTSCLPWPQKGLPVSVPLGDKAPVTGIGVRNQVFNQGPLVSYETGASAPITYPIASDINSGDINRTFSVKGSAETGGFPEIYADLSAATAANVNDLRMAFQLQRLSEKWARSGTRYTEIVKSEFHVTSPDARLQRPEYLGGGTSMIHVHPVAQTGAEIDSTTPKIDSTPLGELAAFGTVSSTDIGFTRSFTEHCYVIGLVSARSDLVYSQGLDRMWSRRTRTDFYTPTLAHLGEQAVLQKEIFASGDSVEDEKVFGYQERWAEMRYHRSLYTGLYRPQASGSLSAWHLGEYFATAPPLNDEFIRESAPMARIKAVESEPDFKMDTFTYLNCVRPMPLYSIPGYIDHF